MQQTLFSLSFFLFSAQVNIQSCRPSVIVRAHKDKREYLIDVGACVVALQEGLPWGLYLVKILLSSIIIMGNHVGSPTMQDMISFIV